MGDGEPEGGGRLVRVPLDRLERMFHFVAGFVVGGILGFVVGSMIGTWIGWHHRVLHDPFTRREYEWGYGWPVALAFGLLFGLGMAFRWHARLGEWSWRLRNRDR